MGDKKKKKDRKRRHSSDSDSEDKKRKKRKHDSDSSDSEDHRKKHKHKKKKKKHKKHKSESREKSKKSEPSVEPAKKETADEAPKRMMKPMTKEEWEKQQSVVRKVYDPDTGRTRLVKGDGEILEEIVSRERQKEINKQATAGDGASFQRAVGLIK